MSLFDDLAARTIRTSADGRRTLAVNGPFARPYDVPGPDTEERVIRRLARAYRALTIPVLALLAFLGHRPDVHSLAGGLAAAVVVGWFIVRASLHPDLRRLRRVDRPSCERTSSDDFIGQLEPSVRALLRRRKRFFLTGFLASCLYVVFGVAMIFTEPAGGYITAVFFGFCAFRWGRALLLPPEALLEMRPYWGGIELPGSERRLQALSEPHRAAKPGLSPFLSGLWDRELDGHA